MLGQMDISLIIDLIFLFAALIIVHFDIKRNPIDRKVFYVWMVGTAIGFYFFNRYAVVVVLVLYFAWTRALLKKWDLK